MANRHHLNIGWSILACAGVLVGLLFFAVACVQAGQWKATTNAASLQWKPWKVFLLSFEESHVEDGRVVIDELEDEDLQSQRVVVFRLRSVHFWKWGYEELNNERTCSPRLTRQPNKRFCWDTYKETVSAECATFRSEPFRSRDFSVLVVSVSRHFRQIMKSCRNLTCSVLMQTYLNQRKLFFFNYKHDPRSNS